MLYSFLLPVLVTTLVFLACSVPALALSLLTRRTKTAKRFTIAAVIGGVIFGLLTLSTERSVERCEADGGLDCGDAYLGLIGLLIIVGGAFLVTAIIAAVVIGVSTPKRDRKPDDPGERFWCDECADWVIVEGHDPTHRIRPIPPPS